MKLTYIKMSKSQASFRIILEHLILDSAKDDIET